MNCVVAGDAHDVHVLIKVLTLLFEDRHELLDAKPQKRGGPSRRLIDNRSSLVEVLAYGSGHSLMRDDGGIPDRIDEFVLHPNCKTTTAVTHAEGQIDHLPITCLAILTCVHVGEGVLLKPLNKRPQFLFISVLIAQSLGPFAHAVVVSKHARALSFVVVVGEPPLERLVRERAAMRARK